MSSRPPVDAPRILREARACAAVLLLLIVALLAPEVATAKDKLLYHGGPVLIHPSATYLINWDSTPASKPSNYLGDLAQFVRDWGGTTTHGVLTQYYQDGPGQPHVSDTVTLGGVTTDTAPMPKTADVGDPEVKTEIRSVVQSNHWPEGYRANYVLLLPKGIGSGSHECGWHNWTSDPETGLKIFYAAIRYAPRACIHQMPGKPYPHGVETDQAIDTLSHELAEIATDPWYFRTAKDGYRSWFTADHPPQEVGDICQGRYGPRYHGADAFLHGNPYLIQELWSNKDNACTLAPVLGSPWGPYQTGYGEVKPSRIYNGGDQTGLVRNVKWKDWGKSRAKGEGKAYFVWPGLSVAGGSIESKAKVEVWDLGPCKGGLGYRRISWYFPKFRQKFKAPDWWINPCTGQYSPYKAPRSCSDVEIRSPRGWASNVQAEGIGCDLARKIIRGSRSVKYARSGESRFREKGLYCGTMGTSDVNSPAYFECAKGSVYIYFDAYGSNDSKTACGSVSTPAGGNLVVRIWRGDLTCRTARYVIQRARPYQPGNEPSGPDGWSCWHSAGDHSQYLVACEKGKRQVRGSSAN